MFCTECRPAESVTEVTEDSGRGAYTEHIFTDPLGAQHTVEALTGYSQR